MIIGFVPQSTILVLRTPAKVFESTIWHVESILWTNLLYVCLLYRHRTRISSLFLAPKISIFRFFEHFLVKKWLKNRPLSDIQKNIREIAEIWISDITRKKISERLIYGYVTIILSYIWYKHDFRCFFCHRLSVCLKAEHAEWQKKHLKSCLYQI